jgi:hypothetical protein
MRIYQFNNESEFLVILTSGLVPDKTQMDSAQYDVSDDGVITVSPVKPLTLKADAALKAAGIIIEDLDEKPSKSVSSWLEIIKPKQVPNWEPSRGMVLFAVFGSNKTAVSLASELIRLGCDRQEIMSRNNGDPSVLLKAVDPSYFTVSSALDKPDGLMALVPAAHGQDNVWIEAGYSHPLLGSIKAPRDKMILVTSVSENWITVDNGPWTGVYNILDLKLRCDQSDVGSVKPTSKFIVPLRLARNVANTIPHMWVIRDNAVSIVDNLVQTLPQDIVTKLTFAHTGDKNNQTIILRARPGQKNPPEIVSPGEAYSTLFNFPNLYSPTGSIVEPPLKREKIRDVLAPNQELVTWLVPNGNYFTVERIEESAFNPLSDWVDYVASALYDLSQWVRGSVFDFESFEAVDGDWKEKEKKLEAKAEKKSSHTSSDSSTVRTRVPIGPAEQPEVVTEVAAPIEFTVRTPSESEVLLSQVQRGFLELESPMDSAERTSLWADMANLHVEIGREQDSRDAGLCFVRSLWELPTDASIRQSSIWRNAESKMGNVRETGKSGNAFRNLNKIMEVKNPSRDDVRAVTSILYSEAVSNSQSLDMTNIHKVQVWMDKYDDNLDVRSLWLSRLALSRLSGGDKLTLARARDRVLNKLSRSLSLERDVPTFLRFADGEAKSNDTTMIAKVTAQVEAFCSYFDKTERKHSSVEASQAYTKAYAHLTLAYGLARLGQSSRANALRQHALTALGTSDKIHSFLALSYGVRIDQAIEGLPAETVMPSNVIADLNALDKFSRYKVDRLRQTSKILEPQERLDPVAAFHRAGTDPRGAEFVAMRSLAAGSDELIKAVDDIMTKATTKGTLPSERIRLMDGVLDFFTSIPESQATVGIRTVLDSTAADVASKRIFILQKGLQAAGYFGRDDLVREVVDSMKSVLPGLASSQIADVGNAMEAYLGQARRFGLKEESSELLSVMENCLSGNSTQAVVAKLQLAGGLASLGKIDQANKIIMDSRQVLLTAKELAMPDRLAIIGAITNASAQLPADQALVGISRMMDQLPIITDSFNTNSHFCKSAIQFVESIVLGFISDNLIVGEIGKKWMEEDEYLVRRRIHRDLANA